MQAKNIHEVIALLTDIIEENKEAKSELAYFLVLYRLVTEKVRDGIEEGFFEDGQRMEELDVTFANRYLKAYTQFKAGEQPSECWLVAFQAADRYWVTILQQLLLGINAHINLDLGIAAAEIAPGGQLCGLYTDFNRINDILSELTDGVQAEINKVSPVIGVIDWFAGKLDERIANFSIEIARIGAWDFANAYNSAKADKREALVAKRDASIAWLGRDLRNPGWFIGIFVKFVRLFETKSVDKVIRVLEAKSK